MAQQEKVVHKTGFSTIKILKDHILGVGSYGKVCKANCDGLICAAKIIHETLLPLEPTHQHPALLQHQLVKRRFLQECEFMSAIKHPNIVQFLGVYYDPENSLPILLMELMDISLTKFLENKTPIPYHTQVSICHDIILAVSFLHSNRIIHRDLSGNNILLMSSLRAKVTDFGMASLLLMTGHTQRHTTCPGTDHYMPPEAMEESDTSQYTEKIDCFSFGVLIIQLLTQKFPQPDRRLVTVTGEIMKRVSEVDRRANHIHLIDRKHHLLPVALDCLKDAPRERPTAEQIRDRVASLREGSMYDKCVRTEGNQLKFYTDGDERVKSVCQDCLSYKDRLEEKELIISSKNRAISTMNERMNQRIRQHIQQLEQRYKQEHQDTGLLQSKEMEQLRRKLAHADLVATEKMKQLQQLAKQKKISEEVTAQLQQRIDELDKVVKQLRRKLAHADQVATEKDFKVRQLTEQKKMSEEVTAQLQQRIDELDNQLAQELQKSTNKRQEHQHRHTLQEEFELVKQQQTPATSQETSGMKFNLRWKAIISKKGPCKLVRYCDAALHCQGSDVTVYMRSDDTNTVYAFNTSTKGWFQLPSCPNKDCALVVLHGLLTTIGGFQNGFSDQLYSLSMQGKERLWIRQFPSMPTKRSGTTALWSGQDLIIAGGEGEDATKPHSIVSLKTVEIMKDNKWFTAASLPEPLQYASGTHCNSHIYIVGGVRDFLVKKSVYVCSLDALRLSCQQGSYGVWSSIKIPTLPVAYSTCVSLRGRVLLIGGEDKASKAPTRAIHMYNPYTESWEIISHMTISRSDCFAVVLPADDQILVFGGRIDKSNFTDSVELATLE